MAVVYAAILALCLAAGTHAAPFSLFSPPTTVTELDIPSYLGRWFEMYTSLIVVSTFERNSYCVTADYGLNPNKTISVQNSGNIGSPTGPQNNITGYAYVPDAKEPGKLVVKFPVNPFPGSYWVIKLGPKESTGPNSQMQYQYSVVSGPTRTILWVLARNPDDFRARFEANVLQWLKSNQFDKFYNKPLERVQNDKCRYPPLPDGKV